MTWRIIPWLMAASMLGALTATGQPPAAVALGEPVNKEQIEAALELTTREAAKYRFELAGGEAAQPALQKDPVLRWSNPAAGEIHGNVFLWTDDGRPAVVGSLFKWFSPHTHMSHEFHSLAEVPLVGHYDDKQNWQVSSAGVQFAAMAGAPVPAGSAPRRLLQMRELAKGFSASKIDRDGNQQELRLLPQPAYRYSSKNSQILDGALFVMVQGTDPEVFLLLEARGDRSDATWIYAVARMNSVGFRVRYQDREVWSVDPMPWADVRSHLQPYTTFMHKQADLPLAEKQP